MEIELDLRKTWRQNLSLIYARLRALKDKRVGLLAAREQTKKEMAQPLAATTVGVKSKSTSPTSRTHSKKSRWVDEYLSFTTSGGRLVVAGKSSKQNDELYAKHLSPPDLFFHADIQGAPTVILKDGQKAGEDEKKETAQFAASYSSAWKSGLAGVDVYALRPEQVSKSDMGGYAGKGAFFLSGEREWFRSTPLALKIGMREGCVFVLPVFHPDALDRIVLLTPGALEKEAAARKLSAHLSAKADDISSRLPGGKFNLSI